MSIYVPGPVPATRITTGEHFTTGLALTDTAPSHARRTLNTVLAEWGLGHLADAADLITSELVTNAVLHGEAPASLTVYTDREADGGLLFIEVEDAGEHRPVQRDVDDDATDGRGLQIVGALAEAWDIEPVGGGKCVWASLAINEKQPVPVVFEDEPADCCCGYAETRTGE